jgi:parallel beta-helix repeat protein
MRKKTPFITALFLALLFCLLLIGHVDLARANFLPPPPELPHVYIRSDGSLEPSTLPIQRTGDTFLFHGDLYNVTLEVQRGSILIDGAGYTLQGNGTGLGIILNSTGSVTVQNLSVEKFRQAIVIEHSSGNRVTCNNISQNELALTLTNASSNQILGNQIFANGQAVLLYTSATHNTIAKNNITGNGAQGGIWSEFTSYTTTNDYNDIVENNITQNEGTGVLLRGSGHCRIEDNNITGNKYGVSLSGTSCAYNTIRGNRITGNNQSNIAIGGDPKFNTISLNTIADSSIGVDIFNSNNSEFYHNDFLNNIKQVNNGYVNGVNGGISIGPSFNVWDKLFEGNFWGDYNGTDLDHNGIGDEPYLIDSTNVDHYPLMAPATVANYTKPAPSPTPTATPKLSPSSSSATPISSSTQQPIATPANNPTSAFSTTALLTASTSPTMPPKTEMPLVPTEIAYFAMGAAVAIVLVTGWVLGKKMANRKLLVCVLS